MWIPSSNCVMTNRNLTPAASSAKDPLLQTNQKKNTVRSFYAHAHCVFRSDVRLDVRFTLTSTSLFLILMACHTRVVCVIYYMASKVDCNQGLIYSFGEEGMQLVVQPSVLLFLSRHRSAETQCSRRRTDCTWYVRSAKCTRVEVQSA